MSWVAKQQGCRSLLGEQARVGEAGDLAVDLLGGLDLDAEVVEAAALAGVLDEHELERGLRDGEVGVAGLRLAGSVLNRVE